MTFKSLFIVLFQVIADANVKRKQNTLDCFWKNCFIVRLFLHIFFCTETTGFARWLALATQNIFVVDNNANDNDDCCDNDCQDDKQRLAGNVVAVRRSNFFKYVVLHFFSLQELALTLVRSLLDTIRVMAVVVRHRQR